MPEDGISVSLVRKLAKCSGPNAPVHFLLDFEQTHSLAAIEYVGEVLQTNETISWLEVEFRHQHITVECMANLFQFVSHHKPLQVLEVRLTTSGLTIGPLDEVVRLFLLAAAQNGNIQRVKLVGRPCQYVTEILNFVGTTCKIRELELVDFPDTTILPSWPANNCITTLVLRPPKSARYLNPFSPDEHPGLTGILDRLTDSSTGDNIIRKLHIDEWSWSMSKYLQSRHSSVESLHLSKVDFSHDLYMGLSPFPVFLLGLQGSTSTTELCLEACILDAKGADGIIQALKTKKLGIKVLKLKDMELDGKHIQQLFECEGLERLEFDGTADIIDRCIDCVNDGLAGCPLSSLVALKLPVTSISSLGPSMKIAATTHSLSSLELTQAKLEEADVECLAGILGDERCQLLHLSLEYLSGFDPKIIMAMEGEESKLESLRLNDVTGESLSGIVATLVGSLAEIKTMKTLTIVCPDLTPKMEKELGEALAENWSLESVNFERLESTSAHKAEPVFSREFAQKLKDLSLRNTDKKMSTLLSSSPSSVLNGPGL